MYRADAHVLLLRPDAQLASLRPQPQQLLWRKLKGRLQLLVPLVVVEACLHPASFGGHLCVVLLQGGLDRR